MEGNGERNVWGDGEVHVLLDIWGDKAILDKMDGTSRNSQIYKTIAKRMEDCGFTRTVNQIKYKMKNLKKEYRKYVDHNNGPLTPPVGSNTH
ncbi:Zinc finger and SCAN domain-containing protein 20 [Holothuria leucospilota]|uniref:Zinc finger and SCAN domain-containing protein 20 n=1 Tax=Holothuria leucospilota TaxID=206669 RepID=A0A9Q1BEJ8_HOLLE|nr:Zinc finger and SCAN domain-containing protein 20 [Holothuria leucospilota]